ncbi:MAG: helix-turn-helix transcriptional regulator [Clostridia bacterium]|nr:helix-turn-helix transcriptional regulator [Clostridia bacterium]
MQFQSFHTFIENEFDIFSNQNVNYPLHIHRSFELYSQIEGESVVTIDDQTYTLIAGNSVLIFPYQAHSYKRITKGKHTICIFSPSLVPDFHSTDKVVPQNNLFKFSAIKLDSTDNLFTCKSVAYSICGEFEKNRQYRNRSKLFLFDKITPILVFANENYKKHITLKSAVSNSHYDYAYISKLFKKTIGVSFNQYVNALRVQESKKMLITTQKSITEIAFECGFNSLRNYNRQFFDQTGQTPTEYRKQNT